MKIDLSLNNAVLYADCEIETVAGRSNLKTPIAAAVNIVGKNIAEMLTRYEETADGARIAYNRYTGYEADEVTLTGAMAVWSYLVVFHAVVHRFRKVYYDDGRSGAVLIAAHG